MCVCVCEPCDPSRVLSVCCAALREEEEEVGGGGNQWKEETRAGLLSNHTLAHTQTTATQGVRRPTILRY